ncbi:MAG: hypothetical protein KDA65_11085 [Planctomycetaceae bacterium]|nr:hypothetical protein [Planctomycetaceae bacterium]
MFWNSLIYSCIALGLYSLFLAISFYAPARSGALGFALIFTIIGTGMGLFAPVLAVLGLSYLVLTVVFLARNTPPAKALAITVIAFPIIWLAFAGLIFYDLQIDEAYKEKFPLVSLKDRLNYEDGLTETRLAEDFSTVSDDEYSGLEADRFQAYSQTYHNTNWTRKRALSRIHADATTRFINSQGFGISRMRVFGPKWIDEITEPEPIPLPDRYELRKPSTPPTEKLVPLAQSSGTTELLPMPEEESLWATHLFSAGDFVSAGSNGFVEDRQHVSGFLSHGFREIPTLGRKETDSREDWKIVQLQLVSLLKHGEPVVYNSPELPRMEALKETGTRPLTELEQSALAKLCAGEDLVFEIEPTTIRMLGSLRALRSCLKCHRGEEGQLLGAFTYEFLLPLE